MSEIITIDSKTKVSSARLRLAGAVATASLALDQSKPRAQWQLSLSLAGQWLTAVQQGCTKLNDAACGHVSRAAVLCAIGASDDHMAILREVRGYGPASLSIEGQYGLNLLRAVTGDPATSARGLAYAKAALVELRAANAAQGAVLA